MLHMLKPYCVSVLHDFRRRSCAKRQTPTCSVSLESQLTSLTRITHTSRPCIQCRCCNKEQSTFLLSVCTAILPPLAKGPLVPNIALTRKSCALQRHGAVSFAGSTSIVQLRSFRLTHGCTGDALADSHQSSSLIAMPSILWQIPHAAGPVPPCKMREPKAESGHPLGTTGPYSGMQVRHVMMQGWVPVFGARHEGYNCAA